MRGKHATETIKMRKIHFIAVPSDWIPKQKLTRGAGRRNIFDNRKQLTRKLTDDIRRSENNILNALNSLSENPLVDDHNGPSAELTSDGETTISVQRASHGLDSDPENIDPNEFFIGAQPNLLDTAIAS